MACIPSKPRPPSPAKNSGKNYGSDKALAVFGQCCILQLPNQNLLYARAASSAPLSIFHFLFSNIRHQSATLPKPSRPKTLHARSCTIVHRSQPRSGFCTRGRRSNQPVRVSTLPLDIYLVSFPCPQHRTDHETHATSTSTLDLERKYAPSDHVTFIDRRTRNPCQSSSNSSSSCKATQVPSIQTNNHLGNQVSCSIHQNLGRHPRNSHSNGIPPYTSAVPFTLSHSHPTLTLASHTPQPPAPLTTATSPHPGPAHPRPRTRVSAAAGSPPWCTPSSSRTC